MAAATVASASVLIYGVSVFHLRGKSFPFRAFRRSAETIDPPSPSAASRDPSITRRDGPINRSL